MIRRWVAEVVVPLNYRLSLISLGCFFVTLSALVQGPSAMGHQVPSLSVEGSFSKDRSFEITINLDPRLFLSDQPSSLPPVPIEWYRDQTAKEREKTFADASTYLKKALQLEFNGQIFPHLNYTYRAMDGATNQEVTEESKEVHLLAVSKGRVPQGAKSFRAFLAQDAGVSMILMFSFEGEMDKKPSVVFPGETSREFALPYPTEAASMIDQESKLPGSSGMSIPLVLFGGLAAVVLLLLGYRRSSRGVR